MPTPHSVKTPSAYVPILIVEDENILREFMEEYLAETFFKVTSTGSERQALDYVQRMSYDFIVLIDVSLEDGDGVRLARSIRRYDREQNRHTLRPMFFVTGDQNDIIAAAANELGMTVIRKPYDLRDLVGIVRRAAVQDARNRAMVAE